MCDRVVPDVRVGRAELSSPSATVCSVAIGFAVLAGGASAQATNALSIRIDDAFTKSMAKLSSRVESLENRVDKLERNVPAIAAARSTSTTQTSGQCTVCDLYNASLPASAKATPTRFVGGYAAHNAWTEDPGVAWSTNGGGRMKTKRRSKCSGGNCR